MRFILTLLLILFAHSLLSQQFFERINTEAKEEIALHFSQFKDINFSAAFYRHHPDYIRRIKVGNANIDLNNLFSKEKDINDEDSKDFDQRNYINFNIAIGKEFRSPLNQYFKLVYGYQYLVNFRYFSHTNISTEEDYRRVCTIINSNIQPGMGGIIGLLYQKNSFLIGAEINPYIRLDLSYDYTKNKYEYEYDNHSKTSKEHTFGIGALGNLNWVNPGFRIAYQF